MPVTPEQRASLFNGDLNAVEAQARIRLEEERRANEREAEPPDKEKD